MDDWKSKYVVKKECSITFGTTILCHHVLHRCLHLQDDVLGSICKSNFGMNTSSDRSER